MGFMEDLNNGVRDGVCRILGDYDQAMRYAAQLVIGDAGPDLFERSPPGRIVNAASGLFCDRNPFPTPPPPFVGGQCPGIGYTVEIEGVGENTYYQREFYVKWRGTNAIGPIGSPSNVGVQLGGTSALFISVEYPAGNQNGLWSAEAYEVDPTMPPGFARQPNNKILSATITNIIRQDGQPDNCGNPPYPSPTPMPIPDRTTPITIGDVNAQIALGNGIVQVNGDVTAPIRVNSPDFELTGIIIFNRGDINFNFGPTFPTFPGIDPPAIPDGPNEPDDGKGQIIGVMVESEYEEIPGTTTYFYGANPDVVVPGVGVVSFLVKAGERQGWTNEIMVKGKKQYIPCPSQLPALKVAGTPRLGVTWKLTPVRAKVEPIEIV